MVDIETDTVLVAVVAHAILFAQRVSKSFCCSRFAFSSQLSSSLPAQILVLITAITLLGNGNESCVNVLPATNVQPLGIEGTP
jgi:hypothetical protein